MWLKSNDLDKYIPNDGNYHDIRIIDDFIWVDGELKNVFAGYLTDFKIFNRALNRKEIKNLAKNIGNKN